MRLLVPSLTLLLCGSACLYIDDDAMHIVGDRDGDGEPSLAVGGLDCDDDVATTHPGAPELCNGVDDDCDGDVDEDLHGSFYADTDGDGFGDPETEQSGCAPGPARVPDSTDCDDKDAHVYPGLPERCDGVDNDCDGQVDEDAVDGTMWFPDGDADGFGTADSSVRACTAPANHVAVDGDCQDANDEQHPGRADDDCDGLDDDCDGVVDQIMPLWYPDGDSDGAGAGTPVAACTAPAGHVATDDDCDDSTDLIGPGADERCNSIDDDCDGLTDEDAIDPVDWHADSDGDGFGDPLVTVSVCATDAPNAVPNSSDCDDADPARNPAAVEVCGNGLDDDCAAGTDCRLPDVHLGPDAIAPNLTGLAAGDELGSGMAAGDFNDDGELDLAVGRAYSSTTASEGGGFDIWLGPLDLAASLGAPDLVFPGDEAGRQAGGRLRNLGDLSGDGIDDLGISGFAVGDAGVLFVLDGSPTLAGAPVTTLPRIDGTASDRLGVAFGTGLIDDDGEPDLFVGAHQNLGGPGGTACCFQRGSMWVYPEGTGPPIQIWGYTNGQALGYSGTTVDLNADGIDEMLVGTPNMFSVSPVLFDTGAIYINEGPLLGDRSAVDAEVLLLGSTQGEWLAGALTTMGDMDGDGRDDWMANATRRTAAFDHGGALLFTRSLDEFTSGAAHANRAALLVFPDNFDGGAPSGGARLQPAGDVDGDGWLDILISGVNAEDKSLPGFPHTGLAVVVHGPISGSIALHDNPQTTHIYGAAEGDYFGTALVPLGDLNVDGYDDFAIGGQRHDGLRGAVWLFSGMGE